jgi:hypothetical protein
MNHVVLTGILQFLPITLANSTALECSIVKNMSVVNPAISVSARNAQLSTASLSPVPVVELSSSRPSSAALSFLNANQSVTKSCLVTTAARCYVTMDLASVSRR